jgi:hypothetical protein
MRCQRRTPATPPAKRFGQVKTDDYAERQRRRLIHHPRGAIGRIGNSGNRLTPRPRPQRREPDRVAVLLVTQRPL